MHNKKITFVLIPFVLIIIFSACKKNPIAPYLDLNSSVEGLKVSVEGSLNDPGQNILDILIDWGDSHTEKIDKTQFNGFESEHLYSLPGTYIIVITARDSSSELIRKEIITKVDYKPTSLDNINLSLFKSSSKEYLILTINLHTYQESQQNEKFNLLVDVIAKMDIDFIALQECAQNKSANIVEGIVKEDNMALIITKMLKDKYNIDYNYVWNWSHYGWSIWEEGVAILTKYPLIDTDERYISSGTSINNIQSRKAIYGSYQTGNALINVFSVHTHWRTSLSDQEQNNQIENIKLMVNEKEALSSDVASIVAGDFNCNPTSDYPWSEGYNKMMENNEYEDTYLEIFPDANQKPAQSIYNTVGGTYPGRIDYIFMKSNTRYITLASQIIFKDDVVGRISDHFGVLTKIIDTE